MSVTAIVFVVAGALVSVVDFFMGRKFATMTTEGARAMEQRNGGKPVDLAGLNRLGRIMMAFSPVPLLVLGYVGVSGMAG